MPLPSIRIPPPCQIREVNVRVTSSNGVMDEGSGKIQEASAHEASFIVMDVAIVESHVASIDVQPPALTKRKGRITERSSNGMMDECSGKVQKASTHVPTLHKRDTRSERSEKFHPTG